MAKVKVLARDWKVEIQKPNALEETYVEINGINSITFGSSKNDADTTSFDNGGVNTHIVASRGYSLSVEGMYLVDVNTGERDEGQQLTEDLADQIGPASIGGFRVTDPAGNVRKFMASVNVGDVGGGNDDPTSWGAECTISGKPINIKASDVVGDSGVFLSVNQTI